MSLVNHRKFLKHGGVWFGDIEFTTKHNQN